VTHILKQIQLIIFSPPKSFSMYA